MKPDRNPVAPYQIHLAPVLGVCVSERVERGIRNHPKPGRIRISNYFCLGTYYSNHDLVQTSRFEGRSQMHQATHSGFRPKEPRGLAAQIDHPPYRTLDLARADGELARLQGHIAHAMRVGLYIAQGPRDGLAPM